MARRLGQILCICMILNVILSAWIAVSLLLFPYSVDYGEAPLVDQARRIMTGQALYKTSTATPPYVIANYPPIYPLLIAGVGAVTPLPLFQVGRAISLLAALVSGLIIGLFARTLSGDRTSGWLAAALFWGHPYVAIWSAVARVDSLALAFSLLALWILYRRWHAWPWLAAGLACFLASIYTRQTFLLAAPLAGSIWLWRNDRRRAIVFTAGLAAIGLALFGALNTATAGGFYLNTVIANLNIYQITRTLDMGLSFLLTWPIAALVAGAAIIRILAQPRQPESVKQPFLVYGLAVYSAGAFASALLVGKIGSGINYFLELIAALSIWAAIAPVQLSAQRIFRQWVTALLICQAAWVLAGSWGLYQSRIADRWANMAWYDDLYKQVQTASARGPVLAEHYMGLAVLAGQPVYYQPFEYGQLYRAGLWDASDFADEIANQKFPLILIVQDTLQRGCWPPPVMAAIEDHYEITQQGGLMICRPAEQ